MHKRCVGAVPVTVGCALVILGLLRCYPTSPRQEEKALQECERMIHGSHHATTTDAPTARRERQYAIWTWPRYISHVPGEAEVIVERPIICRFDIQRGEVVYISFN